MQNQRKVRGTDIALQKLVPINLRGKKMKTTIFSFAIAMLLTLASVSFLGSLGEVKQAPVAVALLD